MFDDEIYFTLSKFDIKGNDGLDTHNVQDTPDKVKFTGIIKFSDKILMCCAITETGVSRLHVESVGGEAIMQTFTHKNAYQNCKGPNNAVA